MKEEERKLIIKAQLSAKHIRDGKVIKDYGVVCKKVVTDVFVAYLVDAMQDSTTYPMDVFKYHDSGTGSTGPIPGDTTLETPCAESRDTGTLDEGATANIFKTVATHTYAGGFAITEHGVFSEATGATLLDRSTFSAINVVASDKIEFTYELTVTAGG
jgi:translation elongation factor EF-G